MEGFHDKLSASFHKYGNIFVSPLQGSFIPCIFPRAHALGFTVPPLRGFGINSREAAAQQSPGREPWELAQIGRSPERAAQNAIDAKRVTIFGKSCS